jgi:hypothetical protein
MPNPKGNPDIKQHGFTTDRNEPLTSKLTLRITKSMEDKLQALGEEKAEFCRNAIQKALEERNTTS